MDNINSIEFLHGLKHTGTSMNMEKTGSTIKCSCGAFYDLSKNSYSLKTTNSGYSTNGYSGDLNSFISGYNQRTYQNSA